jgi:long-chain fatty acid transport protein
VAYGVGIFAPFGLGQEYKDKNTSIFRDQTTKIDLMTIVVNPTIAFNVNEILSVGAGIDYMYGKVKYEKSPIVPGTGGTLHFKTALDGTGDAWGYNFGILLKASKNLKIGFNYRSPFHLTLKDGDFVASDNNFGSPTTSVFPPGTTKASGKLELPATAALGVAYTLDRLTLSADADWTFWSSYKSLTITNASVAAYSFNQRKDWKDVCALRFGAEYRVTDPLALRAGFVYDPTPVPADTMGPELPDATRLNYMVGAGYKIRQWTIDGAFMYIQKFDRTVNNQISPFGVASRTGTGFNGTWTGDAWLVGMDVGYKF